MEETEIDTFRKGLCLRNQVSKRQKTNKAKFGVKHCLRFVIDEVSVKEFEYEGKLEDRMAKPDY